MTVPASNSTDISREKIAVSSGEDLSSREARDTPRPVPDGLNVATAVQEDLFRQVGFQIALEPRDCPEENFRLFLLQHESQYNETRREIAAVSEFNIRRYADKIAQARLYLDERCGELKSVAADIATWEEEKRKSELQLATKKADLLGKLLEFYTRRKELIAAKSHEVVQGVSELREYANSMYGDKAGLLKRFYTDFGDTFEQKVNWLKQLKASLVSRYEEVLEELRRNDKRGMGPSLFNFLIALGTTGAIVAGWFFAVFMNAASGSNFEPLSIGHLLRNFMDIPPGRNAWLIFGVLLAFLLLVFFLSKWMKNEQRDYEDEEKRRRARAGDEADVEGEERNDGDDGSDDDSWEFIRAGIHPIKGSIRAKSWYLFFLRGLPWIVIAGAALIIMARSGHGQDFVASVTGESIGFMACILLSGAAYVYVANKNHRPQAEPRSARLEIAVLFAGLLLFNAFVACLLLFSRELITEIGMTQFKQFFALVNFVLVAATTALIIGYGNYYKGLIALSSFLNWKINKVDNQIRKNSGADTVFRTVLKINRRAHRLQDDIIQYEQQRLNILVRQLQSDPRAVLAESADAGGAAYPCLTEQDARLFPEYDIWIRSLIRECQEALADLRRIDEWIKREGERRQGRLRDADELVDLYNNRVHQWNNEIIWERESCIRRVHDEYRRFLQEQAQLKDGYHLGLLYRLHDGALGREYFKPCP